MKKYRSTIKTKIINIFRTQPKVLLWTLWRSGTHWLADMLSEMMGVPAIYHSIDGNDYKKETINQLYHYKHNTILIRHICLSPDRLFQHTDSLEFKIIFLYRDPRDVIASQINMRKFKEGYRVGLPLFPDMSKNEILKWEIKTYGEFYANDLLEWIQTNHSNFIKIKYEDLLRNTVPLLEEIAEFLNLKIKRSRLKQIARDNEFKKRTGRTAGKEDKKSHARKGIIGDYKNQFSLKEQKILNDFLGKALIRMGYRL